jgi:sirohydrochlorin cobaltochelatase
LAYLQFLQPDVGQAIAEAISSGWRKVVILPLLLGEGAHVRRDLPDAVAAATAQTPDVEVRVLPSLLDDAGVLTAVEALARSAIEPR